MAGEDIIGTIIGSMLINLVLFVVIIIFIVLDKDGILVALKLRLLRGQAAILILGKDKRIYLDAAKISGKKEGTEIANVNGLDYSLNPQKIRLYKNKPAYMYYEGITEPLDIDTKKELGYGKMTPEVLSNMLITARQSGQLPAKKDDKLEMLKTLAVFVAAGASIAAVVMILGVSGSLNKLTAGVGEMAKGLAQLMVSSNVTLK